MPSTAILNTFLSIELNETTKKWLLDKIRYLKESSVDSEEIIFNVFSVVINTQKNEVVICNDVVAEDSPMTLTLDDFLDAILKYKCR